MLINSSLLIWAVFNVLISGSQTKAHATPNAECPSPWFSIGKQCFRVVMEESLSWASARDHCNAQTPCGGDLAQPNDVKAMADHLNVNGYQNGYDNGYWLGGSDLTTEGEWRWINNSTITAATGWGHREPNDEYSCEDCLSMRPGWGAANSLKDEGCGMVQHFICERHMCPKIPIDFCIVAGGTEVGTQCLFFEEDKKTWVDSVKSCETKGQELAIPLDPAALKAFHISNFGYYEALWLGGSDSANEGRWVWNDGRSFYSFPWEFQQPDNDPNYGDVDGQDCLAVGWQHTFDDKACTEVNRYICELKDVRSRSSSSLLGIPSKIGC